MYILTEKFNKSVNYIIITYIIDAANIFCLIYLCNLVLKSVMQY